MPLYRTSGWGELARYYPDLCALDGRARNLDLAGPVLLPEDGMAIHPGGKIKAH
jgi:hypothetical protein